MPILPRCSDRWLVERVFKAIGPAPIRIVLGDREGISPPGVDQVATVIIHDRRILAGLMLDPEVAFSEAYAAGKIEIRGNLLRFLEVVYQAWPGGKVATAWYAKAFSKWTEWWQGDTLQGSRKNIYHHYDLGNDFYKLWLDRQMVYTCAYFPTPSATIEEAQEAKLDYVCRKVRLQAGESVVDAGCGWGALALHMARNYGVNVKAFNVSHEQILFARERARAEGLTGQVEFIEDDYRNIRGKFDAFLSVGMLEHVGLKHYAELGDVIHRAIGDSGRGLLHFIGRSHPVALSRWIRKRIFPGSYVPTLREAMATLEPWSYSVLDVENLRLHYARTLEHWLDRFERSQDEVAAKYGEWFARAWRLYLAGSVTAFKCNTMQLFQIVFAGEVQSYVLDARSVVCGPLGAGSGAGARMDSCDVLIVGGGPAGSSCAWKLRGSGLEVAVLDKQRFPRDKICGGWITPEVLRELEIDPAEYARGRVLQPITGFRTGCVGGPTLTTDYSRPVSYGIRRREFDDYLLKRSGAQLIEGVSLTTLDRSEGGWVANGNVRARAVVGAGGHFCPVARLLGAKEAGERAVAAQEIEFEMDAAQAAGCQVSGEIPELYFCQDLKGYGWCFRKHNFLNIGLGRMDPHRLSSHVADFVRFLRSAGRVGFDLPGRLPGHAYLLYGASTRNVAGDGYCLIGDAAGLAYSQSGEGIRPAVESGLMAGEVIAAARSDYSAGKLDALRTSLRERFGGSTDWATSAGGHLPSRLVGAIAHRLMETRWFVRRIVLDRWFLHLAAPGP